jgi:class 3 adenylate cyclase/TolB-like protein
MPADNDTSHERKLVTILAADVAGYSRLMADDEVATMQTLTAYRAVFSGHVTDHKGRVVDTAGDSVLATFDSVVEAVQAAVDIQRDLATANETLPGHRKMHFRIGVNLGDIIVRDDGTIYGDGVNVAARLEALAEPGGVMIADFTRQAVEGKLAVGLADAGEHEVKNIAKPVRAWRVAAGDSPAPVPAPKMNWRWAVATVSCAFLLGILTWQFWPWIGAEPGPEPEPVQGTEEDHFPVIAVVPFENQSGDPEQDYFAIGLTDDLITRLLRFTDYTVIARDSTMQYVGTGADPRQIRADLGARYIVYGGVRRLEDTVRISVRVADGETGEQLWSENFESDLTVANLFEIQDQITEQAAAKIGDYWGVIDIAERSSISTEVPTQSLSAYDCVTKSGTYWDGPTPEKHAEIRDCLERAVETEPSYSNAWASLALIYRSEHEYGFNVLPNPMDRALHAAQRAVEEDPEAWWPASVMADTYFYRHEMDQFRTWAKRAIALNPSGATALASLGAQMNFAGYVQDGMELMVKAVRLNPRHQSWYNYGLSCGYYLMGDYEAGLAAALKLDWGYSWDYMYRAAFYAQLGRMDEARRELELLAEADPEYIPKAWDRFRTFNFPDENISQFLEGLRMAGADIPEDPPLTQ